MVPPLVKISDNINHEVIGVFSPDGLQTLARAKEDHYIKLHNGRDTMEVPVHCGYCVQSIEAVMW